MSRTGVNLKSRNILILCCEYIPLAKTNALRDCSEHYTSSLGGLECSHSITEETIVHSFP